MKSVKPTRSTLARNTQFEGETIEQKVRRVTTNKEPITDGAPLIFTERKDGVLPEYNIRNDKWETAAEGMDLVAQANLDKRNKKLEEAKKTPGQTEAQKVESVVPTQAGGQSAGGTTGN